MTGAWDWIRGHKAVIGTVAVGIWTYIMGQQDLVALIHSHTWVHHIVGIVGVVLTVSGLTPSDKAVKKFGDEAK